MPGGYETDTVTRLETNLDDCTAEQLGAAMEKLLAAGALDVWFTPIQMKKHRPGTMLSVLCEPGDTDRLADLIFAETTAFGLRRENLVRLKLARRIEKRRSKSCARCGLPCAGGSRHAWRISARRCLIAL